MLLHKGSATMCILKLTTAYRANQISPQGAKSVGSSFHSLYKSGSALIQCQLLFTMAIPRLWNFQIILMSQASELDVTSLSLGMFFVCLFTLLFLFFFQNLFPFSISTFCTWNFMSLFYLVFYVRFLFGLLFPSILLHWFLFFNNDFFYILLCSHSLYSH